MEKIKRGFILFFCILVVGFSGCNGCGPSVPQEDKLLNAYEQYVDDIIGEYKKIDAGDIDAYKNIAPLGEIGNDLREEIRYAIFNDEQREKLRKIEEKRTNFFDNR